MFINNENDIFMVGINNTNPVNAYADELNETAKLRENNQMLQESLAYKNSFDNIDYSHDIKSQLKRDFVNEVGIRGTERAFAFSLTEAYFNALVMDESFKQQNENSIKSFFLQSLKEDCDNNIYDFMESVKTKSNLLYELVESCKAKGRKLASKANEKSNNEDGDYDINKFFDDEEDNEELDYSNTSVEEISNNVKEKVLKVIKDEEEQSEKNKELAQDIQLARESGFDAKLISEGPERHTLFKSLMIHHYKDTMFNLKESGVTSEYGTIDENGRIKVDMDYVMCDAILEYTKLELYNTTRLFDYNFDTVKELSESYLLS